jgi:hypothetical protein
MSNEENKQTTETADSSPASCYAIFTGRGGYPDQNERANATFEVGKQYVITGGTVSQSSTALRIEGFASDWNSVLFEFDWDSAPLTFPYRHNNYYQVDSP